MFVYILFPVAPAALYEWVWMHDVFHTWSPELLSEFSVSQHCCSDLEHANTQKASSLRFYLCTINFLWLIFPAVCISHPPWWTQRRLLSPEVCGAAHTERHSDLQRAAQPYYNAALPELCAAYERFRLQPEREKCEEQSMWEHVNAYCMLKTRVWWCTWLR